MEQKLVTVARFDDYIAAEMAKQLPADHGIRSVVTGDNTANVYAGLPAVAEVELQTLEQDAQKAVEVLEAGTKQEQ